VEEPSGAHPTTQAIADRFAKDGPNAEYRAFEGRVSAGKYSRATSVWRFIEDAVTGGGGFSDGAYLFPFRAETENNQLSDKLARRRAEADYDRFAQHVCNAAWDLIMSCSDMIERKGKDLEEFWGNVDNRGTSMLDFLEYPFSQSRRYGTGWIIMDRTAEQARNKAEDLDPSRRPYIYAVPTESVVDWDFDDDGNLIALAILEPPKGWVSGDPCPLRVWTLEGWAVFNEVQGQYVAFSSGLNELGVIPAIPVWNDQPEPGRALGASEMLDVARAAQTVYNVDSEEREIQRKCALFLAIPVKSTSEYDGGKVVIGVDSALTYDGEAGEPRWISPDLTILEKLDTTRTSKKAGAYEMAHLGALNGGVIATTSGFHAEVEFQKTERRIARHAATLEWVEKQLAGLYLRYLGSSADYSITYPRDFGVRDMTRLMDEVERMLELGLGQASDRAELTRLFKARHPRAGEGDISAMVEESISARSRTTALDRVKALAKKKAAVQIPA
jgi:hypothetical protein